MHPMRDMRESERRTAAPSLTPPPLLSRMLFRDRWPPSVTWKILLRWWASRSAPSGRLDSVTFTPVTSSSAPPKCNTALGGKKQRADPPAGIPAMAWRSSEAVSTTTVPGVRGGARGDD
eukprot:3035344-Prymnesium_polylepis.4